MVQVTKVQVTLVPVIKPQISVVAYTLILYFVFVLSECVVIIHIFDDSSRALGTTSERAEGAILGVGEVIGKNGALGRFRQFSFSFL